ncbi:HIT family protein [Candidatus Woesearchaeota archaeon]|nr:HIT family protein [Candidatus Woesearchaeota archaeon]
MTDCIFCRIAKGEIPSAKVFEDAEHIAFLDISPVNKGHTLVVPKAHVETMLDMDSRAWMRLMGRSRAIAKAIVKATGCDGYNVFMNNRPSAGQEVPHAHIHIIPRFSGDGRTKRWDKVAYAEGELQSTAAAIKHNL